VGEHVPSSDFETHIGAKKDVDHGDEGLCDKQTLPEIPWVAHLGEKGDEKKRTTVGI